MILIRIFIGLLLLITGSLFADGYKDSLYFYWLAVVALLLLLTEYLIDSNSKKKQEIQEADNKISSLTILKETNNNMLQISLFPRDKVIVNKESKLDLYVASILPLKKVPEIKLLTNTEWEITISTQRQGEKYADNYEYILRDPLVTIKNERYIHYSFDIKIKEVGQHDLIIQLNNGKVNGEIKNTIFVDRS